VSEILNVGANKSWNLHTVDIDNPVSASNLCVTECAKTSNASLPGCMHCVYVVCLLKMKKCKDSGTFLQQFGAGMFAAQQAKSDAVANVPSNFEVDKLHSLQESLAAVVQQCENHSKDTTVVVCGSVFLMEEALDWVQALPHR